MNQERKYEVRGECSGASKLMTKKQAMRHGDRNMPQDLRAAGFKTSIFISDLEIHGTVYMRITYGMTVGSRK
jgi:hypothetical protein